jgi:glucan phosphoethanolaminetransferase (alkaline phosphatase superfamily)
MIEYLGTLAVFFILSVAGIVPLLTLFFCILNYRLTDERYVLVLVKTVFVLVVWGVSSLGAFIILFAGVHGAAHAPDQEAAGEGLSKGLVLLALIYGLIGGLLVLWMSHYIKDKQIAEHAL